VCPHSGDTWRVLSQSTEDAHLEPINWEASGILMCGGLIYPTVDPVTGEVKLRKAFFPIPKVKIPVIEEGQPALRFCQWGRRQGEETAMDV
ncbi:hypothetical protein NL530_27670, partial [Klebsiella pneumoniae]|nr:hypothetical protein [Klebsiella pneumoniae]